MNYRAAKTTLERIICIEVIIAGLLFLRLKQTGIIP
jgi:hypothetical protein